MSLATRDGLRHANHLKSTYSVCKAEWLALKDCKWLFLTALRHLQHKQLTVVQYLPQ